MRTLTLLAAFSVCMACASLHAEERPLEEQLIEYSRLCKVATEAKNFNDAVLYCKQANTIRSVAGTHVNLGSTLFAHRRYAEAKVHFIEAVNMDPKLRVAQYDLALTCNVLGQKECALKHYLLAAELGDADAAAELAAKNTVAVATPKP